LYESLYFLRKISKIRRLLLQKEDPSSDEYSKKVKREHRHYFNQILKNNNYPLIIVYDFKIQLSK